MSDETMGQGDANVMLILGEIRGAQRETSHRLNNMESKIDSVGQQVGAIGALAKSVGKLEADIGRIEVDVAALKESSARNEGKGDTWATILKSPAVGWVVTAMVALWALFSGQVKAP